MALSKLFTEKVVNPVRRVLLRRDFVRAVNALKNTDPDKAHLVDFLCATSGVKSSGERMIQSGLFSAEAVADVQQNIDLANTVGALRAYNGAMDKFFSASTAGMNDEQIIDLGTAIVDARDNARQTIEDQTPRQP
jgi:hypothetical protein